MLSMGSLLDGYVRWIQWIYETFHLLVQVRKGSAIWVKCQSCSGNMKGLTTSQNRLGHKASTRKNNSRQLIHLWNDKLRECEERGGVIIPATACRCKNVQRLCLWPAISTVMRHLLLCSFPQESANYRGMMTGGDRDGKEKHKEDDRSWTKIESERWRDVPGTNVRQSSVDLLSSDFHFILICRFISRLSERVQSHNLLASPFFSTEQRTDLWSGTSWGLQRRPAEHQPDL